MIIQYNTDIASYNLWCIYEYFNTFCDNGNGKGPILITTFNLKIPDEALQLELEWSDHRDVCV